MAKEKVFTCIASIPARKNILVGTIHSLLPQVDKIYLFLNNYDKTTANRIKKISPEKIEYVIGDNSHGDAGKFYWADKLEGHILTCDDDLIYPPDYVEKIIDGIERHGRKAIVTFHGRVLGETPSESYYNGNFRLYHFFSYVGSDISVHIAGTGCTGWHSDTVKVSMNDFPSANMADIHFSILAQKKKVPVITLAHNPAWIMPSQEVSESIFEKMKNDDAEQTSRVNGVDWKIYQVIWVKDTKGIKFRSAYIINLSHRTDRCKDVFGECVKNNLMPMRINAVDGINEKLDIHNTLMAGHYGCRLSHIKALETAHNNKQEYSLIIEDDCVFAEDFKSKLVEYMKQLPADWDLLYIGGSLMNHNPIEEYSNNLKRARNVLTTHAYIVRRDSIPQLLDVIKSEKNRIDLLFCKFQQSSNCFLVYPQLAWQRKGYSDIVGVVTDNVHLKYAR